MPMSMHPLEPHPRAAEIAKRLAQLGRHDRCAYRGVVYRFINPKRVSVDALVSGAGSERCSGRWHARRKGKANYFSLSPETALSEALVLARYFQFSLTASLPRLLVALRVELSALLDLRRADLCRELGLSTKALLEEDWRATNRQGQQALAQAWGHGMRSLGLEGAIVPSAVDDAGANLILFPENRLISSSVLPLGGDGGQ